MSLVTQFGSGGDFHLFRPLVHCHNDFVAITNDSKCDYLHTIMCSQAAACLLCFDLVKCLLIQYLLKVNKSTPRLHCRFVGGASQLMRMTCKSFCAPPFTSLIVLYKSIYYNYRYIIIQCNGWLVGSGIKAKRGLRRQKSALWPYV